MHIAVIIRLVPHTDSELEISDDGTDIDREWIDTKLNEFDDHALEEAILLKEIVGARVTALAVDTEGADRLLQTAIARGADEAHKISMPADVALCSRTMTLPVAAAVQKLGAELVLTGVQTPHDIYGQLAPYLGGALDWPQASAVSGIGADNDGILVQQELSGGVSTTLRLALPAVVGVQTASQPIRYVAGSKLRQAMSAEIGTLDTGAEPLEIGVKPTGLIASTAAGDVEMLNGGADAVAAKIHALLSERGLLRGERQ